MAGTGGGGARGPTFTRAYLLRARATLGAAGAAGALWRGRGGHVRPFPVWRAAGPGARSELWPQGAPDASWCGWRALVPVA